MSSIIDIARSGVLSYRTALAVTTENVANVNTEGYIRRDVTMSVQAGAMMTPTSAATLGQGVSVSDVRRAFDGLTAARMWASESAVAAAQTRVAQGEGVENAFLPGADGIAAAMDEFFDSLNALSAQPADTGLRRVALQMGQAVASAWSDAAQSLLSVREDAVAAAGLAADKVGGLLSDLRRLNEQMVGLSATAGAVNPLHDQRDALLTELARTVEVNVDLDAIGRANIRLGPGPGGTSLLEGLSAAAMQVSSSRPLSVTVTREDSRIETVVLTGGVLGGQAGAIASLDAAIGDLDALALRFSNDLNAAHRAGLDLNAQPGGDLFRLTGVEVAAGTNNRGTTGVSLAGVGLTSPVQIRYDEPAGLWRAERPDGTLLGSGTNLLDVDGVAITLSGRGRDGDSFTLTPTSGRAIDMRMVLTDPRAFAAASATITAPMAGNTGTASARIDPVTRPSVGLAQLSDLISPTAADAVSFIGAGVVGLIPAGTESISLASFGRQSSIDWVVADADIATGGRLTFTIGSVSHGFTLPPGLTADTVASGLNSGTLLSDAGIGLSDLGLHAGAAAGQFGIAAAAGSFSAGTLALGTATPVAYLTPENPVASPINVFTRDGRQVSGVPLSAAEAASLLTEANGFSAGATYRTDWLNAASGTGYRGIDVQRTLSPGAHALTLSPVGGVAGSLNLTSSVGNAALDIAEGTSARRLADNLAGLVPGLSADAVTTLTLASIPDGNISFSLEGRNVGPLRIDATVAGGDLSALARAINNASGATAITAEVSSAGDRILLRQSDGEDIRLSGFVHGAGGSMTVTASDADGVARAASQVLGTATGVVTSVTTGQVRLTGVAAFATTMGGLVQASSVDAMAGGMATRVSSDAGDTQTWSFRADADVDAAGVSADGLTVSSAGLSHNLEVNGLSFQALGATTSAEVSHQLVAALRENAPTSSLMGNAVATLPPNGAATAVVLDGATYVLRMEAGALVIEGPESGRLTGSFDASNRLLLSVNGGSPDGIGLSVPAPGSAAFGLDAGALHSMTGQPVDLASLPAGGQTVSIELNSTRYDFLVTDGGGVPAISAPAGFPGSMAVMPDGALNISVDSAAGPFRILAGGEAAGLGVAGVIATVDGSDLRLQSVSGAPPSVALSVSSGAGERLTLGNLPPEDLIVVMGSPGALRLSGEIVPSLTAPSGRPTHVQVEDPATGKINLIDTETGHSIATGFLNDAGVATLGGYRIALTGLAQAGDGFSVTATTAPSGDSRALQHLIALADKDPTTGQGGFARILAEMTTDFGAQLKAGRQKETAVQAVHETLSRKMAEIGSVDLDAEAAKLIELQQAYQASAQALSIARQLFDTILNVM